MAIEPYHGKTAEAYFTIGAGSITAFDTVLSWTCTLTAATAPTVGMGDSGTTVVAGLNSGTCSITCVYDGTKYVQLDEADNAVYVADTTGIEIELLRTAYDSDFGYIGGAICTGVTVDEPADGTPTITYNFQWTGAVTKTVTGGAADP